MSTASAPTGTTRRLARICVLVSGNGSNLQAILDATAPGQPLADVARVTLVVANKSSAYGLTRARNAGIPTYVHTLSTYRKHTEIAEPRKQFDADLAAFLQRRPMVLPQQPADTADAEQQWQGPPPDLIVLAGWMHILSPTFLDHFVGRVINLHPALPGEFDGIHAIERAYEASRPEQATPLKRTGVMVHQVVPEVDRGAPILTEEVPIYAEDTLEALETRIHQVEHRLLVTAIAKYLPTLTLLDDN
ncbi:formyl transferase [Syncephalis fuscata]|nr:formyl transferase [Syncephalis fuscata]